MERVYSPSNWIYQRWIRSASYSDPFDWSPDDRFMLDHQLELLQPLLGSLCPKTLPANYPGLLAFRLGGAISVAAHILSYIWVHKRLEGGFLKSGFRSLPLSNAKVMSLLLPAVWAVSSRQLAV